MAYGGNYETVPGLTAGQTQASNQYKLVKIASTGGQVIVGTSATSKILGVLQNSPLAGQAAEVAFLGVCKALAEASVAFGDQLKCSTTGRVKTTTNAGDRVVGVSLGTASTSAGDIIPVLLCGLINY